MTSDRRTTTRRAAKLIATALALAMMATACGGASSGDSAAEPAIDLTQPLATSEPDDAGAGDSASTDDTDDTDSTAAEPEPTATPEPLPEPEPPATPTPTPEPERLFWHDVIGVGDCFNRSEIPDENALPTPIDCDGAHEEEIFAVDTVDFGPEEPYPGDDELFSLADEQLCADATVEFLGADWDLLGFDTLVLYPTEEEWAAGDRSVMCSAGTIEGSIHKIGSAAGAGLVSDERLVVRASLTHNATGEPFEDWMMIGQHDPLEQGISLTAGDLDLQRRRPALLSDALLFAAAPAGSEELNGWMTIPFDGSEGTLGSPVENFDYGMVVQRGASVAFVARESLDADTNLFALVGSDAVVLGDGPNDEDFPTLTPDGSQVIFRRDGDLWIVNIDGSDERQLTDTDASEWESAVSPDGQFIAFASDRSGNDDIWLMPIEGGEAVNLTDHPAADAWPTWSADGSMIYFQSDRVGFDDRSVVMVMTSGGAEQSYFSAHAAYTPVVIGSAAAEEIAASFPTLDDRYSELDGDTVAGPDGELTEWIHSSERLSLQLPGGWTVVELEAGLASLVAAIDPAEANSTWGHDAIYATLHESASVEEFVADHFDTAFANVDSGCERTGGAELSEVEPGTWVVGQENSCGSATARVMAIFNSDTGLGIVVEGQSDDEPSAEADQALLTEILLSVTWQ